MRLLVITAAAAMLFGSVAFASGNVVTSKTSSPAPVNTVTPAATATMATSGMMMIYHKVADYAKWRPVYDADQSNRDATGLTNCQVHQSMENANDVVIVCNMADMKKAKDWASSKPLKDTMKKAGVKGKPEMFYLTSAQ